MGLFSTSELKFNTEKIKAMQKEVEAIASELSKSKKTLLEAIESMEVKWDTPAGKDYMEKMNLDWAGQVDAYIEMLNATESLLSEAASAYDKLETQANALVF